METVDITGEKQSQGVAETSLTRWQRLNHIPFDRHNETALKAAQDRLRQPAYQQALAAEAVREAEEQPEVSYIRLVEEINQTVNGLYKGMQEDFPAYNDSLYKLYAAEQHPERSGLAHGRLEGYVDFYYKLLQWQQFQDVYKDLGKESEQAKQYLAALAKIDALNALLEQQPSLQEDVLRKVDKLLKVSINDLLKRPTGELLAK